MAPAASSADEVQRLVLAASAGAETGAYEQLRATADYVLDVGAGFPERPKWASFEYAAASVKLACIIRNMDDALPALEQACGVSGNEQKQVDIWRTVYGLCCALSTVSPKDVAYQRHAVVARVQETVQKHVYSD